MLLNCCATHGLFVAQRIAKIQKEAVSFLKRTAPYEVLLLFIVFLVGLTYCKISDF